jgi:hypothetical protein
MKNYLSFGGGVNSVAMMLLLLDQKQEFEAVFVDHETDWPETYEYFNMFQGWLKKNGYKEIIVLSPGNIRKKDNKHFNSLYEYCYFYKMVPSIMYRWCTRVFKVLPVHRYIKKPCFMLLGIDWGEAKRAKISTTAGVEHRWPLIEAEIDRDECKEIIKSHGLPIPMKSGCYICPYQRVSQWRELRIKHPELFCKAEKLENANKQYRIERGKKPLTLSPSGKSLRVIVDEKQKMLFKDDEYPPCQCGL